MLKKKDFEPHTYTNINMPTNTKIVNLSCYCRSHRTIRFVSNNLVILKIVLNVLKLSDSLYLHRTQCIIIIELSTS